MQRIEYEVLGPWEEKAILKEIVASFPCYVDILVDSRFRAGRRF